LKPALAESRDLAGLALHLHSAAWQKFEISEQLLRVHGRFAEGLHCGRTFGGDGPLEIASGDGQKPSACCPQEQMREQGLCTLPIGYTRRGGDFGQQLIAVDGEFRERGVG
jgi:hypothetical protein